MAKNKPGLGTSMLSQVEKVLNSEYKFRRNIMTGKIEYALKKGNQIYNPISDIDANTIWRYVNKKMEGVSRQIVMQIINSDYSDPYDPIREYLTALPKWDNKTDYIALLAAEVKTNNDELFVRSLKKWLIGFIGCGLGETKNDLVFTLSGGQNLGKTTWLENLCPTQLNGYYHSGNINPNDKDSLVMMSECWIVNIDEFDTLGKGKLEELKSLVSKGGIKVRKSYRADNENFVRRASFVASTNKNRFLTDTEGNRRYLCFNVKEAITRSRPAQLIDKVMAQALALYKQGESYTLADEELQELEHHNQQYLVKTDEMEAIESYFISADSIKESSDVKRLTATQITEILNEKGKTNKYGVSKVGKALTAMKFTHVKSSGIQFYCVKSIIGV